ncbi:unnamed protein product [Amaranthus hypochondriacus]
MFDGKRVSNGGVGKDQMKLMREKVAQVKEGTSVGQQHERLTGDGWRVAVEEWKADGSNYFGFLGLLASINFLGIIGVLGERVERMKEDRKLNICFDLAADVSNDVIHNVVSKPDFNRDPLAFCDFNLGPKNSEELSPMQNIFTTWFLDFLNLMGFEAGNGGSSDVISDINSNVSRGGNSWVSVHAILHKITSPPFTLYSLTHSFFQFTHHFLCTF